MVAEVNLTHLRHNVRLLQTLSHPATVMGVVKANAYGHGMLQIARILQEEGVRAFATATVAEAIPLRQAGIADPILIFSAPLPEYLPAYVEHNLEVTIASQEVAEAVMAVARDYGPLRVHDKIDTGMIRLGLKEEEAVATIRKLEQAPGITLAGLWTHFATATTEADAFALEQVDRFEAIRREVGDAFAYIHLAHSGGLLNLRERVTGMERSLVRLGMSFYGLSTPAQPVDLRPTSRLLSRITQIRTVEAGTPVSYGGIWTAPQTTRIATIGAGYADGYFRLLSNRAEVGIRGRRYPVAGRVCMDMFMVDLGAPDGPGAEVATGDEVVLWGEGGPSAHQVAQWADTIPYELCCAISARVPRRYVDAF